MTHEDGGKRPKRWPILAAGLALLVGAGALAWTLVQPGRPEVDARSSPADKAPLPSTERPSVGRLMAARRAAFPDGPIVQDGAVRVIFSDSRLVDAPYGPVLLSEGQVENAAHVDAGRIAAHYLRPAGDGFAVTRAFPTAAENGSLGRLSTWEVSDLFTGFPVIRTEGGGTWQGYTCTVATLTELGPEGPREIGLVPIGYDNQGAVAEGVAARSVEGRIDNIRRGRSFDVIFSGTESFTESYTYRDGRFVTTSGDSRATC